MCYVKSDINVNTEPFGLIEQKFDRHVIIPDLHGEYELAFKAVEKYINEEDICFVFLGDLIDKRIHKKGDKGIKKTLELLKNLGNRAVLTIANHEWSALGALYDVSPIRREAHEWGDRNFYGTGSTLESYGVDIEAKDAFKDFKKIFEELGHNALLLSATPYFETEKFIAIHAGVIQNWCWEEQKAYMEMVAREMASGIYELQPTNWFSTELACDTKPVTCTDKIVVSGHAHYLTSSLKDYSYPIIVCEDRVVNNGKRVRLASQLNGTSQPLFVLQDWDESIVEVSRD